MMTTENGRLSMMGMFPVPDGIAFDSYDIQQMIIFREPLAVTLNNKQVVLQISGGGNISLSVYKDFAGTNIRIKEFTVYAGTMPR